MASLVSHALITAGEHQTALLQLFPLMALVQDVVTLPNGRLVVMFEPGMPGGSDGFNAFRTAIEGVAPGSVVQAVESHIETLMGVERQTFQLLAEALDALLAKRPAAPTTEADVPSFLVAYRAWHRAVASLRAALRRSHEQRSLAMTN